MINLIIAKNGLEEDWDQYQNLENPIQSDVWKDFFDISLSLKKKNNNKKVGLRYFLMETNKTLAWIIPLNYNIRFGNSGGTQMILYIWNRIRHR